ncbi:hypothetical protein HMSSN036_82600 [Paenibacillus macerans]|nr:hypothetical protein HMSSN036_82600 [Paenibacillus macerans]
MWTRARDKEKKRAKKKRGGSGEMFGLEREREFGIIKKPNSRSQVLDSGASEHEVNAGTELQPFIVYFSAI